MVEGGRLEIYCRLALTVGSNPTLSATFGIRTDATGVTAAHPDLER